MVQTISDGFNTHVKRLSLSASVVIIIVTRLLATSRIITQYFNHLLLFNFTTSPLKIDEPCVSSDTLQVGERLKALQGGKLCQ